MEGLSKNTTIHILMTTDTVGGVWAYSLVLCKALAPFNVKIYLVTTGAPLDPSQKKEAASLQNVILYETCFKLEWMENPWGNIEASGEWLLRLEEELQPDLIHLNCYDYGSLPWTAPAIVVAHSDVWSWWRAVKHAQPSTEWNEYYRRVQAGLQQANFIVAPSKTMMKYIRTIYSVTTPGKVIYNARSKDTFKPGEKADTVFSMGRIWDEAKNIQLLIDAAPQVNYPIRLAGDNNFAANNCSTEGTNICYLGKLSTPLIAQELAAASIYVLPAKYEPFGLTVLEAALSGCALVLGNIDSLKEIWNDSAVYVDTADGVALADTINDLMADKSLRLEYAKKAMRHAEKYTVSQMVSSYLGLYYHLLQENICHKETVK